MASCKYYDCGFCYAPDDVETSASSQSACFDPDYCPYLKSQMTEIEEVKAQIKVLEKKLALLEELEKTKSPVEEAYKDWLGQYPELETDSQYDVTRWHGFQAGYNAAYEEKVAQEPEEEPEELKTLYDILRELDKPMFTDDVCSAVKRWMSQYTHNVMTGEYLKGYEECLTVLGENLK